MTTTDSWSSTRRSVPDRRSGSQPDTELFLSLAEIAGVFVALIPLALGRFEIPGHTLWLVCSLIALALFWIGSEVVQHVSRELRALKTIYRRRTRVWIELIGMAFWAPASLALVAIVLGLLPDQEPALYLASVVLLLFTDAWLLCLLVFSVGRPQAASAPDAPLRSPDGTRPGRPGADEALCPLVLTVASVSLTRMRGRL